MPLAGPRRQATAASPRFTLISSAPSASDRFHGNPGGHDSAIPLGFHWLATLSHRPAWEGGGASNKTCPPRFDNVPKTRVEATEKYSSQVRVEVLPTKIMS